MTRTIDRKLWMAAAFGAAALAVEIAVTRTAAFQRGGAVPMAVLVDLVVVLPLATWAFVLRPRGRAWLEAAPALTVGTLLAGACLAGHAETRVPLRVAGAVTELAVLGLLLRRMRAAARELRGAAGDDVLARMHALTDPVLRLAGAELAIVYYAVVGPRRRTPTGPGVFATTESSGLGGLLFAFGMGVAVEGLAVHLIVHPWSPRLAWGLTAMDGYALLALVALHQAARLRPVVLEAGVPARLLVRTSLLWTAEVPLALLVEVTHLDAMTSERGVLRAALGAPPGLLLRLRAPVVARGPFGIRRAVQAIALHVDDPHGLQRALAKASDVPYVG